MSFSSVLIVLGLFVVSERAHGRVVTIGTPVVFTGTNGGGEDEIQAPVGYTATKSFYAGGTVNAAWYTPYDNIKDLGTIATIDVQPQGQFAQLSVRGTTTSGRVRIRIYADIN
ncbi:uncharacterized protein LOC124366331 isoform X2 [Homalodisca vitripennis]|uniref:uncharacterized protein LOC124366331 isoform X2 n=1 Tax=Homalodisca vitripennis TaxID=197043 RepID=UPI001EEC890B|nr:uncharacterized protein LOC124366331 isoform X2 [Homalodisca vitripennis]KAG8279450.1 hypothetical protein J6590_105199 [Homalodisca vitripennis]